MLRTIVLVVGTFAGIAHGALFAAQSPVMKLTPANFDKEILRIEKPAMVAFTAPWCGHCQKLAPQYQRVASELDEVVKIAYMDCDDKVNQAICAKYNVKGFPTLKLFPATKKRIPRDYNGDRSAQAITDYVVSALPAESVQRLEPSKLQNFLDKNTDSPKVLLVSPKSKSSPMYRSLALDFRGRVPFGYLYAVKDEAFGAVNEVLNVKLDLQHVPALYMAKGPRSDLKLHKYRGSMKYKLIKRWLDEVLDGKVVADEPEKKPATEQAEQSKKPESKAKSATPQEEYEAFKRAGYSDKEAKVAMRISEQYGQDIDQEDEKQVKEKAKKKREAIKRQLEALRRVKEKGKQTDTQRDPVTGEKLMDKLQDLIGDKWGTSLASLVIKAKEKAEQILQDNPARALHATEESELYMLNGINGDIKAIEEQLLAGVDEDGYPLTKDMEETMRNHHEVLQSMAQTIELRMDARKKQKSEEEVAEELLAHYDL
ncbi:protein disulfide-isomerase [Malassezia yamatoensis]|uniref:Protein disulfide-isomerase n=1 Tax=Malassezia yamatoensis TaxID=253288 RepID=A0AAJ6CH21_9BASI|nr:protein disulfide-isomerase [Malassezia yamatoensis]